VPIDTIAYMLSWSIFGAAAQLGQATTRLSSEQLAHDVQMVIMEGVARLADTDAA
jgi:hypothetical protein